MAKVLDYMSSAFSTEYEKTSVQEAFKRMVEEELAYLVVVNSANQYVGIVTEVDMIKLHDRADFARQAVIQDIILPSLTLNPGAFMVDAAAIINNYPNIDQIPVVQDSQVHGIILKPDIMRWALKQIVQE